MIVLYEREEADFLEAKRFRGAWVAFGEGHILQREVNLIQAGVNDTLSHEFWCDMQHGFSFLDRCV